MLCIDMGAFLSCCSLSQKEDDICVILHAHLPLEFGTCVGMWYLPVDGTSPRVRRGIFPGASQPFRNPTFFSDV